MTTTFVSPSLVSTLRSSITVVVTPRESFDYTQQSLDSIYKHTQIPFELVYVDGGSPGHIKEYLVRAAAKRGFTLLRTEHFLSSNQARNLGLRQVTTDYVVFVDNTIHVSTGWLESLWKCAVETDAAVVCPLTCIGRPLHDRIYLAGGETRIFTDTAGDDIHRRLYEKRFLVNRSAAAIKHQLYRRSCEFSELRCILVKLEVFAQIGPFDEKLLSAQEDTDFSLRVNQVKGPMYCDPASVVTYVPQTSYRWLELAYCMLRWSDAWEIESLMHFQHKWDLDMDQYFLQRYKQLGYHRHQIFLHPLLHKLTRGRDVSWLTHIAIQLEQWLNQTITDRHTRLSNNTVKKLFPAFASALNVPTKRHLRRSISEHNTHLSQLYLMLH